MITTCLQCAIQPFVDRVCAQWISKHDAKRLLPPLAQYACAGTAYPSCVNGKRVEKDWQTLDGSFVVDASSLKTLHAYTVRNVHYLLGQLHRLIGDGERLLLLTPRLICSDLDRIGTEYRVALTVYCGVQHQPDGTQS